MVQSETSAAPAQPFDQLWYVRGADQTYGPYPGRELQSFAASGRLKRDTEIALAGGSEWLRADAVPAFAGLFGSAMPPPLVAGLGPSGLQHVHYAGFWIRLLAYVIDTVIIYVASFVIGAVLGLVFAGTADAARNIAGIVGFVFGIFYGILPVGGSWQATPGKRICGLRIIGENGEHVGYGRAAGRYLSYFVSALIFCIGFLMIGWTAQKRGLHDMICSTRVVYGRA